MLCNNFVCAFSSTHKGKIVCTYDDGITDCDINRQMSCKLFAHHTCKWCGHENKCFSKEKGEYSMHLIKVILFPLYHLHLRIKYRRMR